MKQPKNKETPKRPIYSYQLRPGLWVVEVPVSDNPDGQKAIIRSATWQHLVSKGLYEKLSVQEQVRGDTKYGYVVAYSPGNNWKTKRLARLIANCNSDTV
jgi:hypothetical protein